MPVPLCGSRSIGASGPPNRYREDYPHAGTPRGSLAITGCAVLLTLLPFSIAACDDTSDQRAVSAHASPSAKPPTKRLVQLDWIGPRDDIAPDRWLASRAAGVDLPDDDQAVTEMTVLLREAHARFGDTTRMIANRATQLESTLEANGVSESAADIIRSLSAAAEANPPLDGFGGFCQAYLNLRRQGSERDQALAQLTKGGPKAE